MRILWWCITISVLVLPLLFVPGAHDFFRYPKELFFRGTAIVITAVFALALVWGHGHIFRRVDTSLWGFLVAILLWLSVTTALSTNRALSVMALEYTFEAAVFFVAAVVALDGKNVQQSLLAPTTAALVNAVFATLQATNVWNPFPFDPKLSAHLRTSALLGNPNDVGAYLLPVLVVATAFAIATNRIVWLSISAVLAVGIFASQSLSAIAGYGVAVLLLLFRRSRRRGFVALALGLSTFALAFVAISPLRKRVSLMTSAVTRADWPTLTSQRIYPFAAAWDMFKDRPLVGMGPGTFKFHYLDYRMKFNERHPRWFYFSAENFGEAHNDHLQIMAENGLPGWLLFLSAILLVARPAVDDSAERDTPSVQFRRNAASALALAFATLAAGSFPLEMTAAIQIALYLAAVVSRPNPLAR